jgi:hypothetical protein
VTSDKDDIAGTEAAKEQQKRVRNAADLKKERMRVVLESTNVQDLFFEILEECHVFESSYNNSGSIMAFNEGQRTIGLNVLSRWLDASPQTFFTTMQRMKGVKNA